MNGLSRFAPGVKVKGKKVKGRIDRLRSQLD